jgi:hypothetical protein
MPSVTPFSSSSSIQHDIYINWGLPDVLANSCVAEAQAPGRQWVCAGLVVMKVPRHNRPIEQTGVREGLFATPFCSILAELACLSACHTVGD